MVVKSPLLDGEKKRAGSNPTAETLYPPLTRGVVCCRTESRSGHTEKIGRLVGYGPDFNVRFC